MADIEHPKEESIDLTEKPKHPGGRPTSYDPSFCEGFEKRFAEGQSILEVANSMGLSRDTFYEWEKVYPEFSYALNRGRAASQAWWERMGRENLFDTETYDSETRISNKSRFNDRLWTKNVSCRFKKDWADRQEIEHSGTIEIGKPPEKFPENEG